MRVNGSSFLPWLFVRVKNRILGADAIGAHAGEWIQFFTLAIRQKLTIDSMAEMIFIYPTFSEIVKKALSRYLRTQTGTKQAVFSRN
jgi:pyruvate/2-oxoglutarate dehydrogenase complex dihydrolipoamide dehydrogenase (E3) component